MELRMRPSADWMSLKVIIFPIAFSEFKDGNNLT